MASLPTPLFRSSCSILRLPNPRSLTRLAYYGLTLPVESPVLALRDATGLLQPMGATPTMFRYPFFVEDGEGNTTDGSRDLAPDGRLQMTWVFKGEEAATAPAGELKANLSPEGRVESYSARSGKG